jgi:hypothetical protein
LLPPLVLAFLGECDTIKKSIRGGMPVKKTVIYRNRIEVKLLSIVCGIIWGILYAVITTCDLITHNPVLWHNQKCMWIIGFFFAIPVLIVFRYRIIFDFSNRIITYVGYFAPKKQYSFDEIEVCFSMSGTAHVSNCFVFQINNQKLFQISEIDFLRNTRENISCLKELFKGQAKFLYDLERSIERNGYHVWVYSYSLEEHILSIYGDAYRHWIQVGFQAENREFFIECWKDDTMLDCKHTERLIEKMTADFDSLECRILELASQYLVYS